MAQPTAVARVEEALAKAHSSQDTLNVFTSIDDEGALARAAEIDLALRGEERIGPLAGTPIGLKDLIDHEGRTTTCGSAFYRHVATSTAPAVIGLESAGAIVVGRTGLHEWAFGFSSENPHWGPVRNPWDPATSTGGSSGGSAAAVAAGIVPIAIGTDTGGSVRVPAALCGTYGLKVTYGRIPLEGVFPLVPTIDTVGPLSDSVDGIDLAYRAMSGDTTAEPPPRSVRIGVPGPWCDNSPTTADIAAEFESALVSLAGMGHDVHPVEMPGTEPAGELWEAIAAEARDVHREFRRQGLPYGEDIAGRLDDADEVTLEQSAHARGWQRRIRRSFEETLETVDFLVTPTVPVRSKRIGQDRIGGRHYRAVVSYFTALVNHSLHPAMALPLRSSGSPPASLQVIGSLGSEPDLIAFARSLEQTGLATFNTPPLEFM